MRKFLSFICSVLLAFSFCLPVSAADGEKSNEIVILYTNDAHAQWPDITQRDGNGMWYVVWRSYRWYRVHDVAVYDKASNSWKALD